MNQNSWIRGLRRLGVLVMLMAWGMSISALGRLKMEEVPNFSLLELNGANRELYRTDAKAVVLFFTGTGCPIARKSVHKLKSLRDEYESRGVQFWIVNTYPADTSLDCRKEYNELGLGGFPYLRDPKQGVALALGVQRTAEVVVISGGNWGVVYQGAVDDQFVEGGEKASPTENYLKVALEAHLAGRAVENSRTQARGCRISFVEFAGEGGIPDYTKEVAPVLQRHCVECHRDGAIAPWAMDGHSRVKNYGKMIEEVLLTRRMPSWDANPEHGTFANAQVLTREEAQTLHKWVRAGAPRGGGEDPLVAPLPPLPDWTLGKPDVVLRLPERQEIPATGVLEYRQIEIANPFTNEVWIAATDIKPGNRRVVHHAILYAKWPGARDDGSGNGLHFVGWAPGSPPSAYPEGVAKRLPAGARLSLEMHYTTSGVPETDQTEVAFYLAPGPQPRNVEIRRVEDYNLEIPPGSDEAKHSAIYGFKRPATIYGLSPHMHVRGKWMKYELLMPNGKRETLLHVPRYDFKWQLGYALAKPKQVPAGAWLLVTGAFDNSPRNPVNPDPSKRVRFGLQSWEEMFIGFFEAADDPEPSASTAGSP